MQEPNKGEEIKSMLRANSSTLQISCLFTKLPHIYLELIDRILRWHGLTTLQSVRVGRSYRMVSLQSTMKWIYIPNILTSGLPPTYRHHDRDCVQL